MNVPRQAIGEFRRFGLEPTSDRLPEGSPVSSISIDSQTVIQGPVRWRDKQVTLAELLSHFPRSSEQPPKKTEGNQSRIKPEKQ